MLDESCPSLYHLRENENLFLYVSSLHVLDSLLYVVLTDYHNIVLL